ncbi:uncharacterized protein G2W53_021977 [Senna tora]|uniref:Uncharacterized protein n=1 Tax=Senna tora TaxID=362788 RepID=A0A834WK20_9FABA|nr:uncharacterized protein G2W53_021977 [Senna tora]
MRTGVDLMLQLESSRHGRSVDHVLTYSGRSIAVGSQKPSRITRQKTCCANLRNLHELRGKRLVAQVSETRRFALYLRTGVDLMLQLESSSHGRSVDHVLTYSGREIASGFNAGIEFFKAWEKRGSSLNILWTTNRSRILEIFMNYEAKDLLREHGRSMDHVLTYSGRKVTRSGFDAGIGVVKAWEERGSCLNIFQMTNQDQISETVTNYEAKDLLRKLGRSVDHVLTYSGRQITVGSKNPSRITRQKTCSARSETRRFTLYLRTGLDLMLELESSRHGRSVDHVLTYSGRKIAVDCQKPSRVTRQKTCSAIVKAWEERRSCLNIFQTINHGRISETFKNYEGKDLFSKYGTSVDHVLTYSEQQVMSGFDAGIGFVKAREERGSCLNIFRMTNRGRISEKFKNYEAKDLLRNGFDVPIGVVKAWEERGSCLYIFRMINHGRISETFTNYEAKDLLRKHGRSVDHVLTNSMTNRGRITETFSNYEAKDLLRKLGRSVDHVLTYFERQIAVGSQKPSRITRQKTCGANDKSKSDLRNRHDLRGKRLVAQSALRNLHKLQGKRLVAQSDLRKLHELRGKRLVAQAWEERGSSLNMFRFINRGGISETITNYEAKDLMRN